MTFHADTVYLAEGIPDCISLDQLGYSAVATLGASLNQEHARKFSDCETVFICFDGDAAGREGAPKVARLLGTKARIVELPDGLDVNEYFQKHTKADFDKLVSAALDFVTYEVNQIPANTKKTRLPKILKPLLRQLAKLEPAEAEAYLTDVIKPHFKLTGEDVKAYRQQVKRYQKEEAKPKSTVSQSSPYESTEGGMVLHKPDGTTVPLSNFTARIAAEVVEDDGVETRNVFQIAAGLKGRKSTFTVPATQFPQMNWVTPNLGAEAVVYAGYGAKDHCRAAIQLLSEEVLTTHVYTHVGWQKVGGVWVFLHENGAIGPIGPVPNIHTQLFGAVARYTLPPPPTPENLRKAIKASLQFLDLAPLWVTVPLLAAAYRAPLGPADFGLHLSGPTGAGKSELVARVQQHYGPSMDRLNLPANWSSTDNALEGLAFSAKDTLLVIDDFSPSGGSYDIASWHKKADRVLRAQGNLSGRHRMWADGTLRPVKPPRGLIVSTGEDIPRGQSLRARLLILEVSPDDVDWDVLSEAQRSGIQGLYAQAMAGYLCWLADQYESIQTNFQQNLTRYREKAATSSAHQRTPEIVANLAIGLWRLRLYAEAHKVFTKEEGQDFFKQGWDALGRAAEEQVKHQQSSNPARRFLELLAAAIASGGAYVASSVGSYPSNQPEAWGWRQVPRGQFSDGWQSQGKLVGWLGQKDNLYLEPEASFEAAQRMARAGGDGIPIASKTLHRRLKEQGFLKSTDEKRGRVLVRRQLQGQRRAVLHFHKDEVYGRQNRPNRPNRPKGKKQKKQ